MDKNRKTNHRTGFTLIEILVVIALVAILFAIFAPSFADFFRKSRLESVTKTIETTLQQAFSSARAAPYTYGVKSSNGGSNITSFRCEKTDCTGINDPQNDPSIAFESGVINSNSFEIRFIPPHGDMEIVGETADEMIIFLLSGGVLGSELKLYKKSGLIERQ